eukprot:694368-Hanusia_phi.AAC.1
MLVDQNKISASEHVEGSSSTSMLSTYSTLLSAFVAATTRHTTMTGSSSHNKHLLDRTCNTLEVLFTLQFLFVVCFKV